VLGLLAVVIAVALLISAQPKPESGRLEFQEVNMYSPMPEAHFIYHTPKQLKGDFSLACTPVDMLGKPVGTGREYRTADRPSGVPFPISIELSTNATWRLKLVASIPTKDFGVLTRISNVLRVRDLKAWYLNERYFATLYSSPITNPVPSTLAAPPKKQKVRPVQMGFPSIQ
jgi:hypothetical protein